MKDLIAADTLDAEQVPPLCAVTIHSRGARWAKFGVSFLRSPNLVRPFCVIDGAITAASIRQIPDAVFRA
jgi:hypothetical protein